MREVDKSFLMEEEIRELAKRRMSELGRLYIDGDITREVYEREVSEVVAWLRQETAIARDMKGVTFT